MITVTFTDSQFQTFKSLWAEAEANELELAQLFGHCDESDIKADFQLPSDSILEDMAAAYSQQFTGISQF